MKMHFKQLELSKNVIVFWIREDFKSHHHDMLWNLRQTQQTYFNSLIH